MPRSLGAIMAGFHAAWWINEQMMAWLGEKNAADALAQSVPNNVTSEMGLALLDVADAIRRRAEVVSYLRAQWTMASWRTCSRWTWALPTAFACDQE